MNKKIDLEYKNIFQLIIETFKILKENSIKFILLLFLILTGTFLILLCQYNMSRYQFFLVVILSILFQILKLFIGIIVCLIIKDHINGRVTSIKNYIKESSRKFINILLSSIILISSILSIVLAYYTISQHIDLGFINIIVTFLFPVFVLTHFTFSIDEMVINNKFGFKAYDYSKMKIIKDKSICNNVKFIITICTIIFLVDNIININMEYQSNIMLFVFKDITITLIMCFVFILFRLMFWKLEQSYKNEIIELIEKRKNTKRYIFVIIILITLLPYNIYKKYEEYKIIKYDNQCYALIYKNGEVNYNYYKSEYDKLIKKGIKFFAYNIETKEFEEIKSYESDKIRYVTLDIIQSNNTEIEEYKIGHQKEVITKSYELLVYIPPKLEKSLIENKNNYKIRNVCQIFDTLKKLK